MGRIESPPADLKELDSDALKVALNSAETLLTFRAFTAPGGMFVMLLGRFRDDVREALEMEVLRPAQRGTTHLPFGELRSIELSTMGGAVTILLQARFKSRMDDPMLIQMLEELGNSSTLRSTSGRSPVRPRGPRRHDDQDRARHSPDRPRVGGRPAHTGRAYQ
jgi:hypothetical protein